MRFNQRRTDDLARSGPAEESLTARLRRTIAAERPLLTHPAHAVRAAHVIAEAESQLRRLQHRHP